MGYNKSVKAIARVERYLDAMVHSEDDIAFVPPTGVSTFNLSFWIREGIKAAAVNKGYEQYAGLLQRYIIRQKHDRVVAELRLSRLDAQRVAFNVITIESATDALEVIGAALKHKGERMFFPNAEPSQALFEWCRKNGYSIIEGEEGITLTTEDAGELAWQPESL